MTQMPTYLITVKIRTTKPPHESLGYTYETTALNILDPYRKIHDTVADIPAPQSMTNAKSK